MPRRKPQPLPEIAALMTTATDDGAPHVNMQPLSSAYLEYLKNGVKAAMRQALFDNTQFALAQTVSLMNGESIPEKI